MRANAIINKLLKQIVVALLSNNNYAKSLVEMEQTFVFFV